VRLDHLLSKEQLARLRSLLRGRVQSHISSACLEVASSLVEHWLFGPSVTAGPASTAARKYGEHGTQVRGATGPSTLLGPEGTAASVSETPRLFLGQDRFPAALSVEGPGPPVS
jgi:hypothetical protein